MRFLLIILSILLLFSSCYKDADNTRVIEVITEQPKTDMETGLMGYVDVGTAVPMSDYSLIINDEEYKVQESHFFFHTTDLHKQGQLIEVVKDEKTVAVAYSYLIENDINRLKIKVLPKPEVSTFSGNLEIESGLSLSVAVSDLVSDNGQKLNGEITASKIMLSEQEQLSQLGSSAYDRDGNLLVLDPSLGFVVSLNQGTENLVLDQDALTTLKFSAYKGKKLFVFHTEFEYWLEVGTIGTNDLETDQLGYFIIADAEAAVYSEGIIKNDGDAISYLDGSHQLDENSYPFTSTEKGRWAQVLPETRGLTTSFMNPCNEIIGTGELSTTESSITNYVSEVSNSSVFNVTGEIVDCDGNNLNNPSIAISSNDASEDIYVFSESSTNKKVAICNSEFTVAGYDILNSDRGPEIPWALNADDALKYISNCSTLEDGYTYVNIDGEKKVYPHFNYLSDVNETSFFTSNSIFEIRIQGNDKNLYSANEVHISINDPAFGEDGYYISCFNSELGCGITELRVTHINESGAGWIRASFKGELWMRTIRNPKAGYYPIEGVVLIKQ